MIVLCPLPGEKLLTLLEAAKLLPRRRRGRPVHVSFLRRCVDDGICGEFLPALRIGASLVTTERALFAFFAAVTAKKAKAAAHPQLKRADDGHITAKLAARGLVQDEVPATDNRKKNAR